MKERNQYIKYLVISVQAQYSVIADTRLKKRNIANVGDRPLTCRSREDDVFIRHPGSSSGKAETEQGKVILVAGTGKFVRGVASCACGIKKMVQGQVKSAGGREKLSGESSRGPVGTKICLVGGHIRRWALKSAGDQVNQANARFNRVAGTALAGVQLIAQNIREQKIKPGNVFLCTGKGMVANTKNHHAYAT